MTTFAVISRHEPTQRQRELADEQGVLLEWVGDMDAFAVHPDMEVLQRFDGVVVVHPAAAMRLCTKFPVGIFENANRAPVGEAPKFEAAAFHVFDVALLYEP